MASQSVAIVGVGLKSIGRHIAEEAARYNRFKTVILGRQQRPEIVESLRAINASVKFETVDFGSVDAIKAAYQKHKIDTVIVSLGLGPDAVKTEVHLIEAAVQAGVRRFAGSGWAYDIERHPDATNMYKTKPEMAKRLRDSGLEWTFFSPGLIMNWQANGKSKPGAKRPTSNGHFSPNHWIVECVAPGFRAHAASAEKATAEIPGDGNVPIIFTRLEDMGQYVARACALQQKWTPTIGQMIGDKKTWNEVVSIIEEVQGRKFDVTYRPISEWDTTKLTGGPLISAQVRHGFVNGVWGDWQNELGAALEAEGLDHYDEPITTVRSFQLEWSKL